MNHRFPVDDLVIELADVGLFVTSGATYDREQIYRYRLWRRWDPVKPIVVFIMLNPSTATARKMDPTVRRCAGYANTWGFGSVEIVNLFGYRTFDPHVLAKVDDPVGPLNDRHIRSAVGQADQVIAAWGVKAYEPWAENRVGKVLALIEGFPLHTVVLTKDGRPGHPLYLKGDLEPTRWTP